MLTLKEREIAERAVALAIMSKDKPRAVLLAMVADEDFQMYFPLTPQNARELRARSDPNVRSFKMEPPAAVAAADP